MIIQAFSELRAVTRSEKGILHAGLQVIFGYSATDCVKKHQNVFGAKALNIISVLFDEWFIL